MLNRTQNSEERDSNQQERSDPQRKGKKQDHPKDDDWYSKTFIKEDETGVYKYWLLEDVSAYNTRYNIVGMKKIKDKTVYCDVPWTVKDYSSKKLNNNK